MSSGCRNESNSHQLARTGTKKIFHELDVHHMSTNQESNVFGLRRRNKPNSHELARIGKKKIFHEFDVHHVQKVGVKRFWAQEGEMSS